MKAVFTIKETSSGIIPISVATLLQDKEIDYFPLIEKQQRYCKVILSECVYQTLPSLKGLKQDNIVITNDWYNRKPNRFDNVCFIGVYPTEGYFEKYASLTTLFISPEWLDGLELYLSEICFLLPKDLRRHYECLCQLLVDGTDWRSSYTAMHIKQETMIVSFTRPIISFYKAIPKDEKKRGFTFCVRYNKLYNPPEPLWWAEKRNSSIYDAKLRNFLSNNYKIIKI